MKKSASGFTLLEIMAVILIIGLAIGGVSLAVNQGGLDREIEDSVERFMAVSAFAGEKAILSGEPMGLVLEPPQWQAEDERDYEGLGWRYRWRIMTENGWQDLPNLPAQSFPVGVDLEVEIDEITWDWEKTLVRGEPVAAVYPSGDISPIYIEITTEYDEADALDQHIEINETGELVWRQLEEYREELRDAR